MCYIRNIMICSIAAILVTGCASSSKSRQPTEKEIESKIFESAKRSLLIKQLPVGADMESWGEQGGLMASGFYKTWTGDIESLPESPLTEEEETLPAPEATYEKYVPGTYEGIEILQPVDIMR